MVQSKYWLKVINVRRSVISLTPRQQAWAARFFWSGDWHLLVDAWMPGLYDKARFAAFLEAWEHDIQVLREAYPELKAFLKDT